METQSHIGLYSSIQGTYCIPAKIIDPRGTPFINDVRDTNIVSIMKVHGTSLLRFLCIPTTNHVCSDMLCLCLLDNVCTLLANSTIMYGHSENTGTVVDMEKGLHLYH